MPKLLATLLVLAAWLTVTASASAARAYNDPWLEGDLAQLHVPQALDILARTPQHVIVGDVDSGARLSDPDLVPHLVKLPHPYTCSSEYSGSAGSGPDYAADSSNGDFGCDFIGSGTEAAASTVPDGDPADPYGHGTGTAAIIAAVPGNGIEGAGVAPNARVLPVRACYGGNPDCYNEPALAGLQYAVAEGATVVNASWPPANGYSSSFRDFVHASPNVLFVFAIGGSGQNAAPYTICTNKTMFPNVLCVGLANADDSPGTTDADTSTDVSAPGYAGVPSASGARAEFGYTSGAAAHVSGAAALLRGIAPDLSATAIANVLVSTSRPLASYMTANRAHGIVDVEAAVRSVQQADGLVTPAAGAGAASDSPDPLPTSIVPPAGGGGTATPPVTSTPVAPAPTPVVTPIATPKLTIRLKGLPATLKVAKLGAGLTVTVTCSVACATTARVSVTHATAVALGLVKKTSRSKAAFVLTSKTAKRTSAGALTIKVTFTKRTLALLKAHPGITLTESLATTGAGRTLASTTKARLVH